MCENGVGEDVEHLLMACKEFGNNVSAVQNNDTIIKVQSVMIYVTKKLR